MRRGGGERGSTHTRHPLVAVSYLNTKPLLYGLLRNDISEELDIKLAIPSECARRLKAGEAEIGLVPVAILPELDHYELLSDYCIGADGAVATVCLYADRPIEELTAIYLDHHSRTSAMLTRLLFEEFWQREVTFLAAEEGYIDAIGGRVGGLVIGDRAIGLEERFPYVYDLAEVWKQHTGLPFVFAAWVATKPLTPAFKRQFNAALREGLDHVPQLQYLLPSPHPNLSLERYFTECISYELDGGKRAALGRFLAYVRARG